MITISQGELVAFVVGIIVIVLLVFGFIRDGRNLRRQRLQREEGLSPELEPWAKKWIATHRSRPRSTAPAPPSAGSAPATPHDPPPTA